VPFGYPVFLDLAGVEVLVVGGGAVALRKATGLAEAGANVTVVAPEVGSGFERVAATIERRPYHDGEAGRYGLVVTATDDPSVNARVSRDAREAKVWVNSADDPANCTFILPAVARRGLVTVAVSTGGASPALARRLRTVIAENELTPAIEAAAASLSRQRDEIHAAGGRTEDVDWQERVDAALRAPNDPIR
jgi:precorrin-2 dehydrogenase